MITVSESAAGHLTGIISEQGEAAQKVGLRVYVKSGGCSGFSYDMGLDDREPQEGDQVVEAGGIKVYVDAYSAQYLEGAEIDYVDELMGGGFTINNPNATKTCGCGHSFQTADGEGQAKSCAS